MATYLPNATDVFPDPVLYTPDFSFLDQMLKRRTSMYEQGYAQVAGKYNYLNRELTNPMNITFRDKFLKSAKDNLKNLSSMDLSVRQNVENASTVFEPFYKNRTALGDMALTEHWNQQEAIADSFRLKDGGKEFSEDNIRYVQMQREQFRQADPSQWQSYYSGRHSYSPYYNYYNEVQEAMKNFKPSSVKTVQKDGFYLNIIEDKSWYKEELNKYLSGVLTDKAKQQMGIEATVRLASNPQMLSSAYAAEANKSLPVIDRNLDQLNRKIKAEKNPNTIKELKKDLEFYESKKEDITTNLAAIQSGDMSYIKNNASKLANLLYVNQKMEGFIDAYAHKDIAQDIKFDDAAIAIWKDQQEWARTRYKEDRADEREKGKQSELLPVSVAGENVTAPSLGSLNDEVKGLEKQMQSKHSELKDHIAIVMGGSRSGSNITDAEFQVYLKNNPGDKMVAEYTKMGLNLQSKKTEVTTFDTNANDYARKTMGDSFAILEKLRAEKQKLMANPGSGVVPKVEWDQKKGTYIKTMNFNGNEVKMDVGKYYYESGPTGGSPASVDKQFAARAVNIKAASNLGYNGKYFDQLEETYKNLKNDYLKNPKYKDVTSNRKGFQLNTTDPRYKNAADFLQQNSGIDKDKIMSITYVPTPTGLDIQFGYSETKENKVDTDAAVSLLQTRFANNQITVDKTQKIIKIKGTGSMISPKLDPYSIVDPIYKSELQTLEQSDGPPGADKDQMFIVQDKAGRNLSFRIRKKFGNSTEGDGYYLYGDGTSRPLYDTKFDNALLPYKTMMYLLQEDPTALNALFESKK
jgi:hypothetical protein